MVLHFSPFFFSVLLLFFFFNIYFFFLELCFPWSFIFSGTHFFRPFFLLDLCYLRSGMCLFLSQLIRYLFPLFFTAKALLPEEDEFFARVSPRASAFPVFPFFFYQVPTRDTLAFCNLFLPSGPFFPPL